MLLTLKDVARELNCTYETARLIASTGELKSIRVTERCIRIHPDSLNDYIHSKLQEAKTCEDYQETKKQSVSNIVTLIQEE